MLIIWLTVLIVTLLLLGFRVAKGFEAPGGLADFVPMWQTSPRRFLDQPTVVQQAYEFAIADVPSVSLADHALGSLLIDVQPTVRIFRVHFGMVLRMDFRAVSGGCEVHLSARRKGAKGLFLKDGVALGHVESKLRMTAKRLSSITEVISKITNTHEILPPNTIDIPHASALSIPAHNPLDRANAVNHRSDVIDQPSDDRPVQDAEWPNQSITSEQKGIDRS